MKKGMESHIKKMIADSLGCFEITSEISFPRRCKSVLRASIVNWIWSIMCPLSIQPLTNSCMMGLIFRWITICLVNQRSFEEQEAVCG